MEREISLLTGCIAFCETVALLNMFNETLFPISRYLDGFQSSLKNIQYIY